LSHVVIQETLTSTTHSFTLPHRPTVITPKATKWKLHVRTSKARNKNRSEPKVMSTIKRNVGETTVEPGVMI